MIRRSQNRTTMDTHPIATAIAEVEAASVNAIQN